LGEGNLKSVKILYLIPHPSLLPGEKGVAFSLNSYKISS